MAIPFKDYEQMLQKLRIPELQQILALFNINLAGRKSDLKGCILTLLGAHFELVSSKIHQVYTHSINEARRNRKQVPTVLDDDVVVEATNTTPTSTTTATTIPTTTTAADALPTGNKYVEPIDMLPLLYYHNSQLAGMAQHTHTQMPIHPDVRFKRLADYDVLGTLLQPSTLLPSNGQRLQQMAFYFTLTPQQASELALNRSIGNSSQLVQLRFCLLETSCEQEDCLPPSLGVRVNDLLCELPCVLPTATKRANVAPIRTLNITPQVHLSPTVRNTVVVQWTQDYVHNHCMAVHWVKKLTAVELLQRLQTKRVKPADYTRALIKEKLAEDADCEVATNMLKVSLNCPLGKSKMSLPCRASSCAHLQCFDAKLYLQMNERKPTWQCPVCDKPAIYEHLVIDAYFQEVLASPMLRSDDAIIQLHQNGSWSTPSRHIETQVVDSLDGDAAAAAAALKIEITTPTDDAAAATTANSVTVDLTLSDSDDDLPLAERWSAMQQVTALNAASTATTVTPTQLPKEEEGEGDKEEEEEAKSRQHTQATSPAREPDDGNDDDDDADNTIICLDSPIRAASRKRFPLKYTHKGGNLKKLALKRL